MSWYGSHVDSAKKLDQLIDQKPSLYQLLSYPDFIQQLKSYNPKLLQFLTSSNQIINQLIEYLAIPPKIQDSDQRKYKIPAISIQMIQTQAMSIVNSFFKQNSKTKTKYLISFFELICKQDNKQLNNNSILPLLAGYFLRTNICLLNNKYKQTIDTIYENQLCFNLLLQNSQSLSMMNVLQVYLNLDMTKNVQYIVERMNLKLKIVDKMFAKIEDMILIYSNQIKKQISKQQSFQQYRSSIIVENISSVIIEVLEKYYLIADGKAMIDKILQAKNIQILFKSLTGNNQIALTGLSIISAILKYYSFSSFNSEEINNKEANKKNQQRLENQPFIKKLVQIIPIFVNQLQKGQKITIYHMKLIQTINSALSLNSHQIFNCITSHKYFQIIIEIFMNNQNKSILQMCIEKTFFIMFKTQKNILQQYRKYLFCGINIIDLTATRYIQMFKNEDQILQSMTFNANGSKRKGYFGYLMRIMRTYSEIHTMDADIINSIKNKSQLWNKVNRLIIKPFYTISLKELGSYEGISQKSPQIYTVKSIIGLNNMLPSKQEADNNIKVIQQINRQQSMQNLKTLEHQNKIQPENHLPLVKNQLQKIDDQFFKTPELQNISPQKKYSAPELSVKQNQKNQEIIKQKEEELQLKKSSFSEYMNSKKIQVDRQIRTKRENSNDGKLSRGKTRLASPSPKRNKWQKDSTTTQQQKQRVSLTSSNAPKQLQTQKKNHLPNIPHHKKGLSVSNQSFEQQNKSMEIQKKQDLQQSKKYSKSMVNLDALKNVKFINKYEAPAKKIYVKMSEDDKAFLDLIGISYI